MYCGSLISFIVIIFEYAKKEKMDFSNQYNNTGKGKLFLIVGGKGENLRLDCVIATASST